MSAATKRKAADGRPRKDKQWYKNGPPKAFTKSDYYKRDDWKELVTEVEGMSKADRLQNFEIAYKELLSCESTAVGAALQTDEDLEQVCLEFQMLYANVALYYTMVEGTEEVTKAWDRCLASHGKLEAAYKAQQQSKPEQSKAAAAVTPSHLSQIGRL